MLDSFSIKTSLNNMVNKEDLVAKVVPGRIYSIKIHPSSDKLLAFAGDFSGELGEKMTLLVCKVGLCYEREFLQETFI